MVILYNREHIDIIEGVQRSFTRRLPGLLSLSYSDELIKINPPSLELRRLRADLTFLHNNQYILRLNMVLFSVNAHGHSLRLFISR